MFHDGIRLNQFDHEGISETTVITRETSGVPGSGQHTITLTTDYDTSKGCLVFGHHTEYLTAPSGNFLESVRVAYDATAGTNIVSYRVDYGALAVGVVVHLTQHLYLVAV